MKLWNFSVFSFRSSNSVFSPIRCSVPFGVWSFGVRSFGVGSLFGVGSNSVFGHSVFGHSVLGLSVFGHSLFGHSMFSLSASSRWIILMYETKRTVIVHVPDKEPMYSGSLGSWLWPILCLLYVCMAFSIGNVCGLHWTGKWGEADFKALPCGYSHSIWGRYNKWVSSLSTLETWDCGRQIFVCVPSLMYIPKWVIVKWITCDPYTYVCKLYCCGIIPWWLDSFNLREQNLHSSPSLIPSPPFPV